MSILPKHHAPLWLATAAGLLFPDHSGKLYGAEDIAYAINDGVDVINNPSVSTKVDTMALMRAFANDNAYYFVLPCDIFLVVTGANMCYTSVGEQDKGGTMEAANILSCSGVLVQWRWRRDRAPMLFGDLSLWRKMFMRVWFAASFDPQKEVSRWHTYLRQRSSRWLSSIRHRRTNPS